MFEEFMGIPVHPLLVHAPVVFVPLLALLAAAYVLVPFVRPHLRWVLGGLAIVAPLSALAAKLSGDAFFDRMDARGAITEGFYPTIENHQDLGNLTLYNSIGLGVLTLAFVLLVAPRPGWTAAPVPAAVGGSGPGSPEARAGTSGKASPDGADATRGGLTVTSVVLGLLTLIAAGVSLYFVIRTGDSGAKAVWTGQ